MYNSQKIAKKIKEMAKKRGVSVNDMLLQCQMGVNTVYKIGQGNDILTLNFAKIADYLECSVDYLLGREDHITQQIGLSEHEKKIISAYRSKPQMHDAVDKLLEVEPDNSFEAFSGIPAYVLHGEDNSERMAAFGGVVQTDDDIEKFT